MNDNLAIFAGMLGMALVTAAAAVTGTHKRLSRDSQDVEYFYPTSGTVKIAIIDTGMNPKLMQNKLKVCHEGSFDFNRNEPVVAYTFERHGSDVADVLAKEMGNSNYCTIIYQVMVDGVVSMDAINAAALRAANDADVVTLSIVGRGRSYEEDDALRQVTAKGKKVFVAAGNGHINLDEMCDSLPACSGIPGVIPVGAKDTYEAAKPAEYSNYGRIVQEWENGNYKNGPREVHGTSYATPRAAASYARYLILQRH